ncbi:Acyl-CoA thioesterase FadM [Actinopolyspora xinjiangensis]|uniref:Acyl-CoA thioesterase FadM n=1 Tax=Actinopolyspora xinjiangensis TaxID=405564 RepID=A0A1H0QKE2_9ACTN|nr:thioesterase family protein [Actinopolyspora xinjiangensis]SDP17229.1 Acyl-CoA thioesterase FadM [Actinopolyspora xinjiangensis]
MNMLLRLVVLMAKTVFGRGVHPLGPCHTNLRVSPTDLDLLGHMNNGVYFSVFDLGRIDLMKRSGLLRRLRPKGWYAVVTNETGSFRRPLRPFRAFTLRTRIIGWDERHLFIEHRIVSGGELTTTAVIQIRFLSRSGERVTPEQVVNLLPGPVERPELPEWVAQWSKAGYEHSAALEQELRSPNGNR